MIGIDMEMPQECGDCPLNTYYPFVGQTRCRASGEVLADNYKTIQFDGRSKHCPLIDLTQYEDDLK